MERDKPFDGQHFMLGDLRLFLHWVVTERMRQTLFTPVVVTMLVNYPINQWVGAEHQAERVFTSQQPELITACVLFVRNFGCRVEQRWESNRAWLGLSSYPKDFRLNLWLDRSQVVIRCVINFDHLAK